MHKWLTAIKCNSVALLPLFFGLKEVDCGEVVCVSPWGFSSDTISFNHTKNVCYTVRNKKIVVTKNKCQKSSSMLLLIKYILLNDTRMNGIQELNFIFQSLGDVHHNYNEWNRAK